MDNLIQSNYKDTEIFYRSLFDQNPDIALYLDRENNIVKVNQNIFSVFGYSVEVASATQLINYLPKVDRALYKKNFSEALIGQPRSMETFFLHRNGQSVPIYMVLVPSIVEGKVKGIFSIIKDKTEIVEIENNLVQSELKFRGIVEEALMGVFIIKDNRLLFGNPYCHRLLGTKYPEKNFNILDYVHPEDRDNIFSTFDSLKDGEEGVTLYSRIIREDGSVVRVEAHSKLLYIDGEPTILGTLVDITEREEAWERINFLAYYDQLTELPNRKAFEEALEKELVIAKTLKQKLAIMYLDLDRFKYTNDTLGHQVGDKLLRSISKRLSIVLGESHQLFRISGDEFGIISPDCKDINKVIDVAKQIISAMEEHFEIDQYRLTMTTSIGISLFPTDGEDSVALMKNADAALHIAKREGKNTFKVYSSTMDIDTFRAFRLGSDIRLALEENQFEYYFQPKVSTENYKIIGAEALLRWNHPEWGLLSPNEFLPIIEENGLIAEVGMKMNREVAKQIKAWQEKGYPAIPIAVNLSAKRFLDKNLVANFQQILDEMQIEPESFEIEITETSMLENEKTVLTTLDGFNKTGITISLDDFGTGYSSLSYLTKFKKYISTLKIDRSFIMHLDVQEENESVLIVKTLIQLAETLKMTVVAEGVETLEQYRMLKEMGCNFVQGYLFSKPVPALEFEELLKKGTFDISIAPNMAENILEERRRFFRIPLHFPLSGSMTLTRINGRTVDVGKTPILIEDIGIGGLRFLSHLKLTVNLNIILEFETYLFGEAIKLLGSIVWMKEIKPDIYQYGVEYVIDESERAEITPILNKLAIKLRKAPLVPDCSFVTKDRFSYIKSLRSKNY